MGHRKLNLSILIAGFFTLGAAFGQAGKSEAAPIVLAPVVITAGQVDACVGFYVTPDLVAHCSDEGIEGDYDTDHYRVEADTDGEGVYLVVWQ